MLEKSYKRNRRPHPIKYNLFVLAPPLLAVTALGFGAARFLTAPETNKAGPSVRAEITTHYLVVNTANKKNYCGIAKDDEGKVITMSGLNKRELSGTRQFQQGGNSLTQFQLSETGSENLIIDHPFGETLNHVRFFNSRLVISGDCIVTLTAENSDQTTIGKCEYFQEFSVEGINPGVSFAETCENRITTALVNGVVRSDGSVLHFNNANIGTRTAAEELLRERKKMKDAFLQQYELQAIKAKLKGSTPTPSG